MKFPVDLPANPLEDIYMMKNNYILAKSEEIILDKNYSIEEMIEMINEQTERVRSNLNDQEESLDGDFIDLDSSLKDIEQSIIRLNDLSNLERSSLDLSLIELSVLELFSNLTDEDDILLEEVNLLRDYLLTFKRSLIDKGIIKSYKDFEYSDVVSE